MGRRAVKYREPVNVCGAAAVASKANIKKSPMHQVERADSKKRLRSRQCSNGGRSLDKQPASFRKRQRANGWSRPRGGEVSKDQAKRGELGEECRDNQ